MRKASSATTMRTPDLGCGLEWREGSAADGAEFWSLLGPLATDGAVQKEMGEPIVSTANHRWVFGLDEGVVVAAAALILPHDGKPAWLAYGWVSPAHRLRGIWKAIASHRVAAAAAAGARSIKVCTRLVARPLAAEGFALTSQRGSWSYMERGL